jgi:hypothetical protein
MADNNSNDSVEIERIEGDSEQEEDQEEAIKFEVISKSSA